MDADLAALHNSNDCPTEIQRQKITRLLADDAIFGSDMVTKSEHLLKAILSPIRRIPTEIWGEIFLVCRNSRLVEESGDDHWSTLDARTAPLILTHVCSQWRNVANTTLRLWDIVHVNAAFGPAHTAAGLRHILQRSGNLPLTVQLSRRYARSNQSDRRPNIRLIPSLLEFRTRLQHLTLDLEAHDLSQPRRGPFPTLTSLDITLRNPLGFCDRFLEAFRDAPRLREVHLKQNIGYFKIVPGIPWIQLTTLTSALRMDVATAHQLLKLCARLETCSLVLGASPPRDIETHLKPYTLDLMRSFSVAGSGTGFLEYLTLPGLVSLGWNVTIPTQEFVRLHTRSKFKLQHLQLTRASAANGLVEFLSLVPSLQKLCLTASRSNANDVFELFTHPDHSLGLPHLTELILHVPTNIEETGLSRLANSLLQFPGARNPSFPALTVVRLCLDGRPSKFSPAVQALLAEVSSAGYLGDESVKHRS